ncbi:hypothetical protein AB8O38_09495 [Saccharomonospora xinjiangensis]|uniref:hypothetical protein n=1 Tax=Saccharomonospora xinjiangensis TaxID=75294 RepID=UPI00350F284D
MTVTTPTSPPVPGGDQDVDFDALAQKFVAVTRLRRPRVHLAIVVTLGVLTAVCLLATVTRASAVPLIPVAGFAAAAFAARRARTASTDRQLVTHLVAVAVAVAVSLWSMSFLTRTFL